MKIDLRGAQADKLAVALADTDDPELIRLREQIERTRGRGQFNPRLTVDELEAIMAVLVCAPTVNDNQGPVEAALVKLRLMRDNEARKAALDADARVRAKQTTRPRMPGSHQQHFRRMDQMQPAGGGSDED